LQFKITENEQPDGKVNYPITTGNANKQIADAVYTSLSDNHEKTVVLGGDHSISIGSIYGHAKFVQEKALRENGNTLAYNSAEAQNKHDEFCCLWIDAHADINTANTSYSGNIHGQALSYVLKSDIITNHVRKVRGFEWMATNAATGIAEIGLRPERLAYIGLRDIDQMETKLLEKLGITYCSMHEVDKFGIDFCVQKCIDKINPSGQRSTHVSFDIDALDPDFAPSTGTPVPGGLTLRDAQYIGEAVNRMGVNVRVMDLVEVNPDLTDSRPEFDHIRTARHAVYVLESFMGRDRGGHYKPGMEVPLA